MSDPQTAAGNENLQFDRVVAESDSAGGPPHAGVACSACHEPIPTEYYSVNGHVVCERCRDRIEEAVKSPQGPGPLLVAALFGLGAGIAGAFVYFAVIYFGHLEVGIVAILIGYMVGYAVRKGTGGRGGLRFQILAIAITYGSVALAYAPIVVIEAVKDSRAARQAAAAGTSQNARPGPRVQSEPPRSPFLAIAMLLGFIGILPVLVVWGSMPSGLISAFIIFIGMRQAWRMTAAPPVTVYGPYQVGTASLAGSV
jgi:hypothetical protein